MRVFYSPSYVLAEYSFDTTRKAGWVADSLVADPILDVTIEAPISLTASDIKTVHKSSYVDAVRIGDIDNYAESQGFIWDRGMWDTVCAVNGGVVSASRAALQDGVAGSLSTGMHHARYHCGNSYCTFNGLAIAAKTLLSEGSVSSVLILDLDAHFGGGTASLIEGDERITQIDVSVRMFDAYRASANAHPMIVRRSEDYLPSIQGALNAYRGQPDLVLYYAGMDPHQEDSTGGLKGIDRDILEEREKMVFQWCGKRGFPVSFSLAGGYTSPYLDKDDLVGLHRLTIKNAAQVAR